MRQNQERPGRSHAPVIRTLSSAAVLAGVVASVAGCSPQDQEKRVPDQNDHTHGPVVDANADISGAYLYNAWGPSGENYDVYGVPGSSGSNKEEVTNSPVSVAIGVQPIGRNTSKNWSFGVEVHSKAGPDVKRIEAKVGDQAVELSPYEGETDGVLYKYQVECTTVPRSKHLPVEVTVYLSNDSTLKVNDFVDTLSRDSLDRSCVPSGGL